MTLPLNASVSRSISLSGNTPTVSQIEAYEIRVRNSDDVMVQKITDAPPGTTAYIDELAPGVYTISVLAYYKVSGDDGGAPTPQPFTYDCVSYYGKTTVEVFGGETKTTSLTMGSFNSTGSYPCVMIQSNAFDWNEGVGDEYLTLGTYKGRVSQKIEQSNYGNQYEHAITIWVN